MNDINQSSLNVFYEIYEDFSIHLFFYLFCFVFKQTLSLVRVMWVAACSLEYRNVVFAMRLSRVLQLFFLEQLYEFFSFTFDREQGPCVQGGWLLCLCWFIQPVLRVSKETFCYGLDTKCLPKSHVWMPGPQCNQYTEEAHQGSDYEIARLSD